MSELLPHTAKLADDICVIRSMHTEAINHDPAMTMLQSGHMNGGRFCPAHPIRQSERLELLAGAL